MSKRTLLLADDSVTIQKVVNLTFADEGIDVVTVGDGDTAMEKISQIEPDVVLLDVHMPGLNGYQICEIVRQNPSTKDLPVVLLVGSFEPFDEDEAARVGANAFLTKPFQSIRQLVSQVTELMESSGPLAEPSIPHREEIGETSPDQLSGEDVSSRKAPAIDDIESLYHQSFSEAAAPEADTDSGVPRYVDAGMDDEMIEASSLGSDASDSGSIGSTDVGNWEGSYQDSDAMPTYEQSREAGYSAHASAAALDSNEGAASNFAKVEADRHEAPTSEFRYAENDDETAYQESSGFDRGDVGAAVAGAVAEVSADFDEFSRTEQIPALDVPLEAGDPVWDEGELLELPPIESGVTTAANTKQEPSAGPESKQVISLSPEQMDIIVQKIVEKLSQKS